jgi:hypothetical protein
MMRFVVEFIGYNDGMPYEVSKSSNLGQAQDSYKKSRKEKPDVPHRLVQILQADGPLRQDDT